METTIQIKVSELNHNFIDAVKKLFDKDREIKITISSGDNFVVSETRDEYLQRLLAAIKRVENNDVVVLSEEELTAFVNNKK